MTEPADPAVATFYLRVPRAQRSYVHWILEAHEGLATLTEPADADGELVVTVPLEHQADLLRILDALRAEVPLVVRPDLPVS